MNSKSKGLSICLIAYLLAFLASLCFFKVTPVNHQWMSILAGHIGATLVIFIFSSIFKNSSLYDPFWSIAPFPIVIYIAFWPISNSISLEKIIIVLLPVLFWSYRLTHNWARHWEGMDMEDWRYIELKKQFSKNSYLIDLFGIHIYPTLQVNICLFPLYYLLSVNSSEVSIFLYIASIFTFLAVILEKKADDQMRLFKSKKENLNITMQEGLWKYSRHPNYLGEALFWWGLYLMTLSTDIHLWWLFLCPMTMTLMFILKTCSMMDQRSLTKRSDYQDYMNKTSQIFLWFPSNKKTSESNSY
jgi:steroid 5-alpha reductase family enzyme